MSGRGGDRAPAAAGELPELLAFIAERAGHDAALRFAEEYGGARKYIPKTVRPGHPINLLIGVTAARALSGEYGGIRVLVPLGPISDHARRGEAIEDRLAAGATDAEVARDLHIHIKTVRRARKRLESSRDDPAAAMAKAG